VSFTLKPSGAQFLCHSTERYAIGLKNNFGKYPIVLNKNNLSALRNMTALYNWDIYEKLINLIERHGTILILKENKENLTNKSS